ncbi:MAG: hypothetical protein JJ971_15395 [Balneolaceae bacterium]|nr:hypothetical protein [Balneolaceae bacterium]MBO6547785.1 hypothetical protein [Balneolaceae bacterium]MBO6648296.1 hypothetical protein [Balneolaceae bacterium]
MRTSLLLVLSFALICSCSSQKELARKSVYNFSIDGEQFQITSINTESGEGTNFLSRTSETGTTILKARDLNQDGTIDIILKGSWSLFEANLIYNEGIVSAKAAGNFAERTSLRTFEFQTSLNLFTIKSYSSDPENVSNLFIIIDKTTNSESIFQDSNADGKLESTEKGTFDFKKADILYAEVLKEGIDRDQILFIDGIYMVKKASELLTYSNN